jgi:hypothetical protein
MTSVQMDKQLETRTAKIRTAAETIVTASQDWSNEIETALQGLPPKERTAFVVTAGRAIGMLGDYCAVPGGAR